MLHLNHKLAKKQSKIRFLFIAANPALRKNCSKILSIRTVPNNNLFHSDKLFSVNICPTSTQLINSQSKNTKIVLFFLYYLILLKLQSGTTASSCSLATSV